MRADSRINEGGGIERACKVCASRRGKQRACNEKRDLENGYQLPRKKISHHRLLIFARDRKYLRLSLRATRSSSNVTFIPVSHPCARAKTGARAGTPMFTDTRPRLFMRPSEIWPAAKIAIDVRKLDGCQAFLPPIRRDRSLALLLRRTATFLGFLETGGEGRGTGPF